MPARNPGTMRIGTATALYCYPVKGLRGESLATAEVLADGFAHDRSRALIVGTAGHPRAGKTYRGKEQPRLHVADSVDAAQRLAAGAGVDVTATAPGRYFDLLPISMVFDTWLGELEALTGTPVEALRFRPNIVIAAEPGYAGRESDLLAARLRIGTAEFDVNQPIERCVTPSYDLATGERDATLARAIAVDRRNDVGIYCTVAVPGTIALGDAVERIDAT